MKFLLVDDDIHVLKAMARALRILRQEIVEANNACHALEKLNDSFDVILTDWKMLEMNGVEFIKKVRQGKFAHVHIILMSGDREEEVIQASTEAGADGYLVKPTTIETLEEMINFLE